MKNSEPPRGYTIVEPPIHGALHWEMDTIVACLGVIRRKLPEEFKEFPSSFEYDLLALGNPHEPPYPVIGIHTAIADDLDKIPDMADLDDRIEKWIRRIGLDQLRAQALKLETPTWAELEKVGHHPER